MVSQDCYTTFCGLYSHELYERPIYERTLPSTSFIESELPTEFEALKESPELTGNTKTFGYVNITSNWISEIQQCFRSAQQPFME